MNPTIMTDSYYVWISRNLFHSRIQSENTRLLFNSGGIKKGGGIFFRQSSGGHLGAYEDDDASAVPGAGFAAASKSGDGSGSGCSTGDDADLGGGAPPSLELADLEIGVEAGDPSALDAEARHLCGGGGEAGSAWPASATSMSSTWRSLRWRVRRGGGGAASRSPGSAGRCWAREVEARAGEVGVEAGAATGQWKADLERFHHDCMVTGGREAVRVGLVASEAEGVDGGDHDDDLLLHLGRLYYFV
jgi:hypothetical protein